MISVLEGLKTYLGTSKVNYSIGCSLIDANWPESEILPQPLTKGEQDSIDAAISLGKQADLIVAVLGEDEKIVGESKTRTSLDLPGRQLQLLQALQATGKPVVLILINGRPLSINWANKYTPAIIEDGSREKPVEKRLQKLFLVIIILAEEPSLFRKPRAKSN